MPDLFLVNPTKPRKAGASRRSSRAKNPAAPVKSVRSKVPGVRRGAKVAGRRRNPIGAGSLGSVVTMVKDAVIGGAGAVAIDVLMGQVNKVLPANLQTSPTQVGAGDAVKALLTVAVGTLLAKPTKGLSRRMAVGALTCQSADVIRGFVPATMQLGYMSPAKLAASFPRSGPNAGRATMSQFAPNGRPLLSQFTRGAPQMVSGLGAAAREQAPFVR